MDNSTNIDGVVINDVGTSAEVLQKTIVLLGELELGISDGIESIEINDGHSVAKYDTISGKPLVRSVGSDVRTVSIRLTLVNTFGMNVKDRVLEIKNMQGTMGLFLVVGSGVVFKVVITTVRESILKMNGSVVTRASLQIEASEYDERNVVEIKQVDKKKLTATQKKQRRSSPVVKEEVKKEEVKKQYEFKLQKTTHEADSTKVVYGIVQ